MDMALEFEDLSIMMNNTLFWLSEHVNELVVTSGYQTEIIMVAPMMFLGISLFSLYACTSSSSDDYQIKEFEYYSDDSDYDKVNSSDEEIEYISLRDTQRHFVEYDEVNSSDEEVEEVKAVFGTSIGVPLG